MASLMGTPASLKMDAVLQFDPSQLPDTMAKLVRSPSARPPLPSWRNRLSPNNLVPTTEGAVPTLSAHHAACASRGHVWTAAGRRPLAYALPPMCRWIFLRPVRENPPYAPTYYKWLVEYAERNVPTWGEWGDMLPVRS